MSQGQMETINCSFCGILRKNFVPGTSEDHCPNCGFKEGCCSIYESVKYTDVHKTTKN